MADDLDLDAIIDLDPDLDKPTKIEAVLTTAEIQAMIAQLSVTEDGEPLRDAMSKLKKAILDNPDACISLLNEDIGEMVKHLTKMTGKDMEEAISKSRKSKKGSGQTKIDLSSAEIQQEILDDLKDD